MLRWMRIGDFALTDELVATDAIHGTPAQAMLGLIREDSLELQDLRRFLWELGHFDIQRMSQHQVLAALQHSLSTGRVGVLPWVRMQEILFTPRSSEGRAEEDAGSGTTAQLARANAPRPETRKPTPAPKPPPKIEPAPRPSRPPPKVEPVQPPPRPKVEPVPLSVAVVSAPPLIPDDWNAPPEAPAALADKIVAAVSTELPPDNYDFLTDKYINPISQAQIDHNRAVDLEDFIKSEMPNYDMRDLNLVENARQKYEESAANQVIEYHEFLAIRAYTDDLYSGINPALRSGDPGKWSQLVASAESGLDKLAKNPAFSLSGTMTRGMDLGAGDVAKLFPDGGTFSDKAFISSSYDSTKAFSKNVRLIIETVTPQAKVGCASVYGEGEAEVLFKTGCQFEVVSKEALPDNKWKIHVREKKS